MAQAKLDANQIRDTYDLVCLHGTVKDAANAAGFRYTTFASRWKVALAWAESEGLPVPSLTGRMVAPTPKPFEVGALPSELPRQRPSWSARWSSC